MSNLNDTLMDLFYIMFERSTGYEFDENDFNMEEIYKLIYQDNEIRITVTLLQALIDEYIVTKKYGCNSI